jgi:hypothetical protein
MNDALEGGNNPEFPEPNRDQVYGKEIAVPYVVGLSEDDARAKLYAAGFQVAVSSERVESDLAEGLVAQQSPSGTAVPGSVISLALSSGPKKPEPPEECKDDKTRPGCQDGGDQKDGDGNKGRGNGGFWGGSLPGLPASTELFPSTTDW